MNKYKKLIFDLFERSYFEVRVVRLALLTDEAIRSGNHFNPEEIITPEVTFEQTINLMMSGFGMRFTKPNALKNILLKIKEIHDTRHMIDSLPNHYMSKMELLDVFMEYVKVEYSYLYTEIFETKQETFNSKDMYVVKSILGIDGTPKITNEHITTPMRQRLTDRYIKSKIEYMNNLKEDRKPKIEQILISKNNKPDINVISQNTGLTDFELYTIFYDLDKQSITMDYSIIEKYPAIVQFMSKIEIGKMVRLNDLKPNMDNIIVEDGYFKYVSKVYGTFPIIDEEIIVQIMKDGFIEGVIVSDWVKRKVKDV